MATVPKEQRYTIRDFKREFPDDDACLEWLKNRLYPNGIHCMKCDRVTKHHRVASRKSYSCDHCGHHVHPTAGTIFHKSSTPLTSWFHAIFLMSQTRCGISAAQLQREVGVTYKTAWRMFTQIRSLLAADDEPMGGNGITVEADETFIGGKLRESERRQLRKQGIVNRGPATKQRSVVVGVLERGGSVRAEVVPSRGAATKLVRHYVLPESMVYTDDWGGYNPLTKTHTKHRRINHSERVYVHGDIHTNSIEGFFGLLKNGIRGVYHSVGTAHLQSYLDEYAFRYNHRKTPQPMFRLFLERLVSAAHPSAA